MGRLGAAFASSNEALRRVPAPVLDRVADEIVQRATGAWPAVRVDAAAFVAHVGALASDASDPLAAVAALHVEDLYLAYACSLGVDAAQRAFVSTVLGEVPQMLGHVTRSKAIASEVQQELARKLLTGTPASPSRIGTYRGEGALTSWIRVAAIRTARSILRRPAEKPTGRDSELHRLPSSSIDPELALVKSRYAAAFAAAFKATLATLDRDARNVLKLHYVDGLSLEAVARAYRVSRATAARWIAKAREHIVAEVERQVGEKLGSSGIEGAKLLSLVESQVDVSIRRLLAADD